MYLTIIHEMPVLYTSEKDKTSTFTINFDFHGILSLSNQSQSHVRFNISICSANPYELAVSFRISVVYSTNKII